MSKIGILGTVLLIGASSLSGGCVNKYRAALQDREAEIQSLREENTGLRASLDEARARDRINNGGQNNPTLSPAGGTRGGDDAELKNIQNQLDGTGVESTRRNGRMVLTLPDDITFASGKASLSPSGKTALKKVSELLKKDYAGKTVWIEGHTDNEPIKKSNFKSNRHLSLERAMAVEEYLKDDAKIEDSRFVVAGHGEFSPIADNKTNEGRKKNRRVELVIGD